MQAWIGKAIAIIGAIHSIFGFVVFRSIVGEIVREGFINTLGDAPSKNLAFWFIFFGFIVFTFGLFVDWCERRIGKLPGFFGWSLLALTLIIVAIMPKSGGWALFIPAVGAILRRRKSFEHQV